MYGRVMYHDFTYEAVFASSLRGQWALDDVLRAGQDLDFGRNFMPTSMAGTADAPGVGNADERRLLNQITAKQYIRFFSAIEEFVLPFVLDHARTMLNDDDYRVRALLNFAGEEAKHIQLFRRYRDAYDRGFPGECPIVGAPRELTNKVLSHHPLAVALVILMFEWMTQSHYVEAIRDDGDIDPLFISLFKHHWIEEAQHAKLDTLIVEALAEGLGERQIQGAMNEYFLICTFLDQSLRIQARLNVETFERAVGRTVAEREALIAHLLRAARFTYLGWGMTHDKFTASLQAMSPRAAARVADVAKRAPRLQPLQA